MKILLTTDNSPSSQVALREVLRRPWPPDAERWGADLIVLGSHGHSPAVQMLLGSVSHRIILHAPCSVEVVRGRMHTPAEVPPSAAWS